MAESEALLRQRRCGARNCGALFWICRSCDRGHRYCSPPCRRLQRREQLRQANRRHQQSPEGRADHRDRQRAYRRRLRARGVTDQGRQPNRASVTLSRPRADEPAAGESCVTVREECRVQSFFAVGSRFRAVCVGCGRRGRFVNPFHWG